MSTTPAAHPAQYRELTGLDPDALRRRPTPYEQIMRALPQIAVEPLPGDAGGLEIRAADAPADTATNEAQDTGHDETLTDSSPSGDVHPDLGERVL